MFIETTLHIIRKYNIHISLVSGVCSSFFESVLHGEKCEQQIV